MSKDTPFDQLSRVSAAFQESSILAAAAELDLFTAILEHENRISVQELAEILQTDIRGTSVLLDALTATEYLEKSGIDSSAAYSVTTDFAKLLDSRNPATFIPMLRHMSCVQRCWTRIADTVKTGTRFDIPPSILGAEEDRASFIWAMNSIAGALVRPVLDTLWQAKLLTFNKFIDIGGASGTYAAAFLRTLPRSEGTIVDLPVGIAAARQRFTASEFEHRIQLVEADFFRDEFPTGFDFAWVSAVIHQFDRSGSRELYKKAFRSLRSGGKIAVRDFMMNAARTAPKDGAFFGINMLVETQTGRVYTFEEVKSDLESAGFTNVKLAVSDETMSAIAAAEKPQAGR
ncbi:MAG: methyltransferase domain-containing protein [Planctomycetaceae bacterium]|jgi:SAM-dependent methyltransferase|nr:methyltransferase domain-containing protein [Planctomycetaceae bacterium]